MRTKILIALWVLVSVLSFAQNEPFEVSVEGTDYKIKMMPIPEGEYKFGSPEGQEGHKEDEGPEVNRKISAFWMSEFEITWDVYEKFMFENQGSRTESDAVSTPTPPYVDMSFGMGTNNFPAICMTQYAAMKFCEWLSAKTGMYFRLPTEAEWEYACQGGTENAYSFGENASVVDDFAWYITNTDAEGYKEVGLKKPNQFGLHDMHGNVAEWTMDQYSKEVYTKTKQGAPGEEFTVPSTLYNRVTKGGSWVDDPADLRCAARKPSISQWKVLDPQIPKSKWWLTSAQFVGFRIIRPVQEPSEAEKKKFSLPAIIDMN